MSEAHLPSVIAEIPRLRGSEPPTSPPVHVLDSDGEHDDRNTSGFPSNPPSADTTDPAVTNHQLLVPTQQRRRVAPQRRTSSATSAQPRRIPELDDIEDQYAREMERLQRERDDCIKAVRQQDSFVDEFRTKFTKTKLAVGRCITKFESASTMADMVQALRAAKREVRNIPAEPEVVLSTVDDDAEPNPWVRTRNAALQSAVSRVEATLRETQPDAEDFASTLAARLTAFMNTNQGKRIVASAPGECQSLCYAIQQLHGALVWRMLDLCDASLDVLGPLEALRQQLTEQDACGVRERDDDDLDELPQERRSQPSAERGCVSPSGLAAREDSPEALPEGEASTEEVDLAILAATENGDDEADAVGHDHPARSTSSEPQACHDDADSERPGGWLGAIQRGSRTFKTWLEDH